MTDFSGLYYLRARYYSPELMRFINADTVKGNIYDSRTLNNYAYANGNPVSMVDPFGTSAEPGMDNSSDDPNENSEINADVNCYGFAMGVDHGVSPGDLNNSPFNFLNWAQFSKAYEKLNKVATADDYLYFLAYLVILDGARPLGVGKDGLNAPIGRNEYRIAMRIRVSNEGKGAYHFMKQKKDGNWAQKTGDGKDYLFIDMPKGYTPEDDWDIYLPKDQHKKAFKDLGIDPKNYYNSKTIYFAISEI